MNVHGEETNHLKTILVFDSKLIHAPYSEQNKGCFYHDIVSKNCGDGKKLWQALNRILSWSYTSVLYPLMMKNH